MASQVQICNMALSHLGQGKAIANLDTENSEAAAACRTFYDICLEATLRDFDWPFASKTRALSLIEENPNDEWRYSYRYPTDCLKFRRILSGQRTDTPDTRVVYKISQDSAGLILFTDQEDAECEYTVNVTNPALFPSDFVIALSYRLASMLQPRLAGSHPGLGKAALEQYLFSLGIAQASASKEEQPDAAPESEFIRARS
jgi:hypothetical protein